MVKISFAWNGVLKNLDIPVWVHMYKKRHTQANNQPKLKTKQSIKNPVHYHGNKLALYILFLQTLD